MEVENLSELVTEEAAAPDIPLLLLSVTLEVQDF
jgi:hypothetical protein